MEIKKEDLEKRYRNLSDEKLIEIYQTGSLTDIALSALKNELSVRGLSDDKIQNIETEKKEEKEREFKSTKPPKAPKIWVGYIFALALFIFSFVDFFLESESSFVPLSFTIGIAGMLYWLFCVQRFHQILNTLTIDGYSVSPSKAVGFHFIPFFNLYWIFKWPIELSKFVNDIGKVKMISGALLGLILFLSIFIYRLIDGSIGLVCVYSVGLYINNKIKKTSNRKLSNKPV